MNIIIACTLLAVCLLDPTRAERLRENSNVLVPSNDVNLHDKIKKLLNGDEVDPEDFSENEIQSLSEMKIPKIEKLRNNRNLPAGNKVFDDKNKNIEENQIDHDSDELLTTLSDVMSLDSNFSSYDVQRSLSYQYSWPHDNTSTPTPSTTPNSNISQPTFPHTNHSETTSGMQSATTSGMESATTSLETATQTTTLKYSSFPVSTIATTDEATPNYTTSTAEKFNTNSSTSSTTSSAPNVTFTTSTSSSNTTTPSMSTSPTEIYHSTTTESYPGPYRDEICLLEKAENFLKWLDENGSLNCDYIKNNCNIHEKDCCPSLYESRAYGNLTEIPSNLNATLKYLSLAGNNFSNSGNISLPGNMTNLLELDLRSCRLQSLSGLFPIEFVSLKKLFLSNNEIKILEANFNLFLPSLEHLDLSYNLETMNLHVDTLNNTTLKHLDFSFTNMSINGTRNLSLHLDLIELSLCFTSGFELEEVKFMMTPKLKKLDISGKTFQSEIFDFHDLPASLEALSVRNSNVSTLEWVDRLKNLARLDLRENNIRSLTPVTKEILLEIETIAIGGNNFKCNCELQKFMNLLKWNTLNSPNDDNNYSQDDDDSNTSEAVHIPPKVSLGVRNHARPQYDIMARTYQKYYDTAMISAKALTNKAAKSRQIRSASRNLVMKSKVKRTSRTILSDYEPNEENYLCTDNDDNVEETRKQIFSLDLCDEEDDDASVYIKKSFLALWISFPVVIFSSALLIVIYWRWWYIKYFIVLFKNTAILTFMDDSDDGKETIIKTKGGDDFDVYLYDVFVSYSDHNRDWVLDEFIPNVEKRETINVCLHERDFQVGCGILENIVSCMDRSRCLLLLISENFIHSQWCQFEMNLAQHRLLETRREKLILVILEDIPVQKQPRTLKYLMRTKTYIKWPVNGTSEEKQVFWKRLKKAIISSKWEQETYGSIA